MLSLFNNADNSNWIELLQDVGGVLPREITEGISQSISSFKNRERE